MRFRLVVLAIVTAAAVGAGVAAQGTYTQVADIKIGGPLPAQWDYQLADAASRRLYVSHGTEVVVIDTASDKVIGRIADTPGIHGMAVGAGKVFTSNGRENKVGMADPRRVSLCSARSTAGAPTPTRSRSTRRPTRSGSSITRGSRRRRSTRRAERPRPRSR